MNASTIFTLGIYLACYTCLLGDEVAEDRKTGYMLRFGGSDPGPPKGTYSTDTGTIAQDLSRNTRKILRVRLSGPGESAVWNVFEMRYAARAEFVEQTRKGKDDPWKDEKIVGATKHVYVLLSYLISGDGKVRVHVGDSDESTASGMINGHRIKLSVEVNQMAGGKIEALATAAWGETKADARWMNIASRERLLPK